MVLGWLGINGTTNLNEMRVQFEVNLLEEGVETPRQSQLSVVIPWSDNISQMKAKIVAAIVTEAQVNGYTQITNSNNIILPDFSKG